MRVAIANDHVALGLKAAIKAYLDSRAIDYVDFGADTRERTDYPIYADKVARLVASGEFDRGILFCGTGVGMSIAANKVPGIRAVVCSEPYTAVMSRCHNDTNILCLGARVVNSGLAVMIVDQWLAAEFEGGRHQVRLEMMNRLISEG